MVTKTADKPITETRLPMSYEEFLQWSDEDTHAEWVDGEVTAYRPPGSEHQKILQFLLALSETAAAIQSRLTPDE